VACCDGGGGVDCREDRKAGDPALGLCAPGPPIPGMPIKDVSELNTPASIPKENCQNVTHFDQSYKTVCFGGVKNKSKNQYVREPGLCKFVEYFHVFPTSYLRYRKGPAVPERDLQKMDRVKMACER